MPDALDLAEALMRLLADHDLPTPDDLLHEPDGSVVALWHDRKLAVVVEPSPLPEGS
jgi:hypothetical protein